ncbi:hypothetical protein C8F01DRAFT_1260443 [Mycena amicta]|nr:hypothetical protein C8F01DRAFT_1260443 [Mycena amicta]
MAAFDVTTIQMVNAQFDLLTTPLMDIPGLRINTTVNTFVCCATLMPLAGAKVHMVTYHKSSVSAALSAEMAGAATHYNLALKTLPDFAASVTAVPAISGLITMWDKDKCSECGYMSAPDGVIRHIKTKCKQAQPLHGLACQQANSGSSRAYFHVLPAQAPAPGTPGSEGPATPGPEAPSFVDDLRTFDWMGAVLAKAPSAPQVTPWLRKTHWHESGLQAKAADIAKFLGHPEAKGPFGWLITDVKVYFADIVNLIPNTPPLVRMILNSPVPDEKGINRTPLEDFQNGASTRNQYARLVVSLLHVLLRPTNLFSIPKSPALIQALARIRQDGLHPVFRALWMTEWKETEDCSMPDPTMVFLMVQALNKTGEFQTAKQSSGPITQLGWAIRMACLMEVHQMVARKESADTTVSVETVKHWCIEKMYTTFATLRSHGHFAAAIALNTPNLPSIHWEDEVNWTKLQYKGDSISISQLTEIFRRMELKLKDMWEDKILMGTGLYVAYAGLADNLEDATPGHCFIDDIRNPLSSHENDLLDAIFADPILCARFTRDGQLNKAAGREWLHDLAAMEQLLMVLTDMCGGAPPRGPELCNAMIRNTHFRLRNTAALGQHLVLIRQYTKTTSITGTDSLIPHGLGSFVSDLIIQLHTLARPLARVFASHCLPDYEDAVYTYTHLLFSDLGEEFDTESISKCMHRETFDVLLWKMTVAPWRQINIPFRRQLMGEQLAGIDGDVNAKQSGHEKRTENHNYGLTADALFGAPEYAILAFIRSSTRWQKITGVVPGGLGLRYSEALVTDFDKHVPVEVAPASDHGTVDLSPIMAELGSQRREILNLQRDQKSFESDTKKELGKLQGTLTNIEILLNRLVSQGPNRPQPTHQPQTPPVFRHALTPDFSEEAAQRASRQLEPTRHTTPEDEDVGLEYFDEPASGPQQDHPPQPSDDDDMGVGREYHDESEAVVPHVHRPIAVVPRVDGPIARTIDEDDDGIPSDAQLLAALKRLEGKNATWKSEDQLEAVETVMGLEGDVIIALPTGAGKSLAGIIPSLFEDGITLFVAPSSALEADLDRKFHRMGLPFVHYLGYGAPDMVVGPKLVLTTSDKIRYEGWTTAITKYKQAMRMPIVRTVIDEAQHYWLDQNFRDKAFSDAAALRTEKMQFVLMSASCPPDAARWLQDQFKLVNPQVIRGCSDRPELHVVVEYRADLDDMITATQFMIDKATSGPGWTAQDRILVFVAKRDDGDKAAQALNAPFYRAESAGIRLTSEERERMYDDWVAGVTGPVLVCTSALSAGNDYAHVRITIHLTVPVEGVQWVQQCGRAGRDGRQAYNVLFAYKKQKMFPRKEQLFEGYGDLKGCFFMDNIIYKNTRSCLTALTTHFLDGDMKTCEELNHPKCQRCSEAARRGGSQSTSNLPAREIQGTQAVSRLLNAGPTTGPRTSTIQAPKPVPQIQPAPSATAALVPQYTGTREAARVIRAQTIMSAMTLAPQLKRKLELFAPAAEEQKRAKRQKEDNEDAVIAEYQRWLRLLSHKLICGYCFATQGTGAVDHSTANCPHLSPAHRAQFQNFDVQYDQKDPGKPCFKCWIPSMKLDALHKDFTLGKCDYPNFLRGLMFAIYVDPTWRRKSAEQFQLESWASLSDFRRFLGRRAPGGQWPSMILWRFYMEVLYMEIK